MKRGKQLFVTLILSIVVTLPFFFLHGESEVKAKEEWFEITSNTFVGFWYQGDDSDTVWFDSPLTNGEKVRAGLPDDEFWDMETNIIDASYLKIPDYITSINQVEFELIHKPAHAQDPKKVKNPDGTRGLQIIDNYKGTGERRLRVPVVTSPAIAKQNGIIYSVSDRVYRYDTKIIFRINFKVGKEPQPTNGQVEGKVFWELRRPSPNDNSQVFVESNFQITSTHYATRNIKHSVHFDGKQTQNSGQPIKLNADGLAVKGTPLVYSFSYEYTDYPIGTVCSDSGEEISCWWDSSPDWSRGNKVVISDSLMIDHKQGEVVQGNRIEDLLKGYSVGKEDIWHYPTKKRNEYFEEWRKSSNNQVKSNYELTTQTTLPITLGQLIYEVKLPSGEHEKWNFQPLKKEMSSGFYYPADIDDSLKDDYSNNTKYSGYPFAFPLQQSLMQDKGTRSGKRTYEWEYVTDMFFESAATGFVVGIPYANYMKNFITNGIAKPSYQVLMEEGKKKIAEEFTKATGQKFLDDVMYTFSEEDFGKLQTYKIPVTADSPLQPNKTYKNHIVLENMGLNDLTFRFDQTFLFKHYLFGSAKDEAWIVAQREGRVPLDHLTSNDVHTFILKNEHKKPIAKLNKESLKNERMHKFRRADRDFIEKVQQIVGEEAFDNVNKNIIRAEPR